METKRRMIERAGRSSSASILFFPLTGMISKFLERAADVRNKYRLLVGPLLSGCVGINLIQVSLHFRQPIQRILLPCCAGLAACGMWLETPGWGTCDGVCWECLRCWGACGCCCCCGNWGWGWDTCDCGWICPGEGAEGDKWPAAARARSSAALSCSWWNCCRSARSCWRWYSSWQQKK